MGLGAEVINLLRCDLVQDPPQSRSIRQIPMVQEDPNSLVVGILVQVVDAIRIEE